MPRARRSNLSPRSRNAIRLRNIATQSTADEQQRARENRRVSTARHRASQTQEQRDAVRETARLAMRNHRTNHRDQQRDNFRRPRVVALNRVAFHYDSTIDYSTHSFVQIGPMEVVCDHCGALKFAGETPGLCCLGGKVNLPLLPPPPDLLHSLLRGETPESRHFLTNTQRYNGCFQMTSFGANIMEERGFNPTFKVISAHESVSITFF